MAAGIFHVTCHSVWTSDLFRDDLDRMEFLRELAVAVGQFAWTCLSFCLMTNHVHLILEVGKGSLPEGMQQLNTRYACRFNQRHDLRGHVFADRYHSNRIHTDAQLKVTFAYDANNPKDAGACESAADWFWSSYRGTIGLDELAGFVNPERILRLFGSTRDVAIARLRRFVEGDDARDL
jgi:REP element-mobilizing transposase RayT